MGELDQRQGWGGGTRAKERVGEVEQRRRSGKSKGKDGRIRARERMGE